MKGGGKESCGRGKVELNPNYLRPKFRGKFFPDKLGRADRDIAKALLLMAEMARWPSGHASENIAILGIRTCG